MLPTLLTMLVAQPYQVPSRPPEVRSDEAPRRQLGQRLDRSNRFGQEVDAGSPYAFAEFAPPDQIGIGDACAGVNVTGAAGETVTFTRTGTGTCLTGATLTEIQNGTMSTIATGKPRVMPGGDGTGGTGLLIEMARTNSLLRSEEIDNASWSDQTAGSGSAPVLNDAGVANTPLNLATAEDYTFGATGAADSSGRKQAVTACNGTTCTGSCYFRGVSASGTADICITGGASTCTSVAFTTTGWARGIVAASTTTSTLAIGNLSSLNGGTTRAANRVYVWGCQMEVGAGATSYIPTTSAAVTRNAETASMPVASTSMASFGYTYVTPSAFIATPVPCEWEIDTSNLMDGWIDGTPDYRSRLLIAGADKGVVSSTAVTVNASNRLSYDWNGTTATVCVRGACNSATPAAVAAPSGASTLFIGTYHTGAFQANGVIKRVCVSPTPNRCR